MSNFRPATIDDYTQWLTRWLAAGNQPTHYYGYPFNRLSSWTVALDTFETRGECGASSVQIIVPAGIRYVGGDLGHNKLYFHDLEGQLAQRGGWIPVYSDQVFVELGLAEFIAEEQAILHGWEESAARLGDNPFTSRAVPSEMRTASSDDDAVFRALAGATFGPDAKVILPSGKTIDGAEAQVWASLYAPSAEVPRRRRWWHRWSGRTE